MLHGQVPAAPRDTAAIGKYRPSGPVPLYPTPRFPTTSPPSINVADCWANVPTRQPLPPSQGCPCVRTDPGVDINALPISHALGMGVGIGDVIRFQRNSPLLVAPHRLRAQHLRRWVWRPPVQHCDQVCFTGLAGFQRQRMSQHEFALAKEWVVWCRHSGRLRTMEGLLATLRIAARGDRWLRRCRESFFKHRGSDAFRAYMEAAGLFPVNRHDKVD